MPDISMCQDKECPSKKTCFRYVAKPNEFRQSYAGFKHDGDKCDNHMSSDKWPADMIDQEKQKEEIK